MAEQRIKTRVSGESGLLFQLKGLARAAPVVLPLIFPSLMPTDAHSAARYTQDPVKVKQTAYVCGSQDLYILPPDILNDCLILNALAPRDIPLNYKGNRFAMACSERMFEQSRYNRIVEGVDNFQRYLPRLFRQNVTDADVGGMIEGVSMYYSFNKQRIGEDTDNCAKDPYEGYVRNPLLVAGGLVLLLGIVYVAKSNY